MTTYELPKVGVPEWHSDPHDTDSSIDVGGHRYWRSTLKSMIKESEERLARLLAAKRFSDEQAELAKWDCAGERAFVAHRKIQIRSPFALSWDELTVAQRDYWVAVAKAVLDGEH